MKTWRATQPARAVLAVCLALGLAAQALEAIDASARPRASQASVVVYRVRPSETNPSIHRFDEPHYIAFRRDLPASANLLVFMSGTGGQPTGAQPFLDVASDVGYRVISLAYDDDQAVVQVCGPSTPPACSAEVRQKRLFGDNVTRRIDDTLDEAIVPRLTALLVFLQRTRPDEGWEAYLDHGAPNWPRIAVSGHSQGAGMAAYLAQRQTVARVVLFSSPWDFYGRNQLAPWILTGAGATPADRWYGAYHRKENTAALIAQSYRALGVPPSHVRVFTLEPRVRTGRNPYHLSMVGGGTTPREPDGSPSYAGNYRFLLAGEGGAADR